MRRVIAPLPFLAAAVLAALVAAAAPEPEPAPETKLPEDDRVRLAEAYRLAGAIGDRIWPGWSGVPFAVVLVTPETEFFIRHPRPPADARPVGEDALLGSAIYARSRTFPTSFLATFPIGGVSTVVVGQAGNTSAAAPADWVATLLHEHFHQLQDSQPGFYERVAELGLARGDTTGMWMLEFPFPYGSAAIGSDYRRAARALAAAIESPGPGGSGAFIAARAALRASLGADDLKYFDFQLWKEGVARYTQLRVARWAAENAATPADAFRALPGWTPYADLAKSLERAIRRELSERTLKAARREVVYPFGAGEALLLDRMRPCWREQYFTKMFSLAPAFDAKSGAQDCGKGSAARG